MATATKTSKITLELTEEEADFISAITQNPMESQESDETMHLRAAIFNALQSLTVVFYNSTAIKKEGLE